MHPVKAFPVVIQQDCVLAFQHPLAGKQFVKGTIEPGESTRLACERELREESGIQATAVEDLGSQFIFSQGLVYGFWRMNCVAPLPESFEHLCADDGGHLFRFFWHPFRQKLDDQWHPIFHETFGFLQQHPKLQLNGQ